MAVKIRLKRMGKIRAPFYRVVVMDSRTKRDGRAIEEIGKYHPTEEPSLIEIDMRARALLAEPGRAADRGRRGTPQDRRRGHPQDQGPKTPKKDLYEAALAAAGGKSEGRRREPRKKAEKKADAQGRAKADEPRLTQGRRGHRLTEATADAAADDAAKAEA